MTFSILARDPATGAIGGAAATGALCVGGWVLRGRPEAGMSASQGMAPSTLWGETVLDLMAGGMTSATAIDDVTGPDSGRAQRQLTALGLTGPGAAYTGAANLPAKTDRRFADGVAAGNMLTRTEVIDALVEGFVGATGTFPERLLAGLRAADAAGSDTRGLLSAALLVVSPDHAPLTLRVDYAETPLDALGDLLSRASTGHYADWAAQVPCVSAPESTYTAND